MHSNVAVLYHQHKLALAIFVGLATLFLWDVLILQQSLAAFDIILSQLSWRGEFPFAGMHQPILIDSPTAHYPQREFEWGHARHFTNVEVNPYIFTGIPWSAQGVGGFLTSLPQMLLGIREAIDWSTWLRLVLAGFFMYLLMLELGAGRIAGVLAGILWAYNLHQIVWLEFPQHLATQLWIPLVFLFSIRVMNRGLAPWPAVLLLVVSVLFFTSGYMQIVLYTYVVLGLFNTFYVLTGCREGNLGRDLQRWAGVHAIYAAAVALCAAGLIAEVKYISEGLRGAQEWRGRVEIPELSAGALADMALDLFPRFTEVTHLLTPDYYGGIWQGRFDFENGNLVEQGRYFSVPGLLLATGVLFVAWRTRHARLVGALLAVMAIVFSLLYRNELTVSALRLIPFADKGSYSRFITPLMFMGCILAGLGLHYLVNGRTRWMFAAMGLAALWLAAAWWQTADFAWTKMWYPLALCAILAGLVLVHRRLDLHRRVLAWALVVVAAGDLAAAGYGFNTRMHNDLIFPRSNAVSFLLNDPEPYRVAVVSDKPIYHPSILSYYDIPVVEGYLTTLPVAYARYMKEVLPTVYVTPNGIMFIIESDVEALRLLNVKYILSDQRLDTGQDGLEHVLETNNHHIFRVRNHLPRVFCASDVFFEQDNEQRRELYDDVLRRHPEPVVVEGQGNPISYQDECTIDALEVFTHGLKAGIESAGPRYLVLPYGFSENWSATLNGEPVELLRANGYHMALRLPGGRSELALAYRNPWSIASAGVFIAVSLGLLVFARRAAGIHPLGRTALVIAALVMIAKSSFSLPGIRADDVPERVPPAAPYDVLRPGEARIDSDHISEHISRAGTLGYPLNVRSRGLARISLKAGLFRRPRMQRTVTVEILDAGGDALVTRRIPGRYIANNQWFTVSFPPIERDTGLSIRVSAGGVPPDSPLVLWLTPEGELCIKTYYSGQAGGDQ